MKKFLFIPILFLATLIPTKAQFVLQYNPAQPGVIAAPIDQNGWHAFKLTVSQNVTNFFFNVIPPAQPPAQSTVSVQFVENATGGFTIVFASNIVNPCTVNTAANATTVCQFIFDSTQNVWNGVTGSGGGGGGSSFPVTTPVAVNSGGSITVNTGGSILTAGTGTIAATTATALAATPSQCTGGQFSTGIAASGNANCSAVTAGAAAPNGSVQVDNAGALASIPLFAVDNPSAATTLGIPFNLQTCGTNPYIDATCYGMRPTASQLSATANCNGTTTVSFTGGSFASLINGDGIVLYQCGATNVLTVPQTLTVTPSQPAGDMGTGFTVASSTGLTANQYQVSAIDQNGGTGPAASVVAIANGLPVGQQSVSISSCTFVFASEVCTTSSAHTIAVGTIAIIDGSSDYLFNGFYPVIAVPDNTHFTVYNSNFFVGNSSIPGTGGTVKWFQENFLSWTAPATGTPRGYVVYGRVSGTMVRIGLTKPTETYFDDYGQGNQTFPDFIPTAPPTVATNDYLATTITSGAPTSTIVVANAATQTIPGVTVKQDNGPPLVAAWGAALSGGSKRGILKIPSPITAGQQYFFNSYAKMPGGTSSTVYMEDAGSLFLNEPIEIPGASIWNCIPASGSQTLQFAWAPTLSITVNSAYPGFYISTQNGSFKMSRCGLSAGNQGSNVVIANSTGGSFFFDFDYDAFNVGSSGNDLVGKDISAFTSTEVHLDHTVVLGSTSGLGGTLAAVVEGRSNPASSFGELDCDFCNTGTRGFSIASAAIFSNGSFFFHNTYPQGLIQPLMMVGVTTSNYPIFGEITDTKNDTSNVANVASWGANGSFKKLTIREAAPSNTYGSYINGYPVVKFDFNGGLNPYGRQGGQGVNALISEFASISNGNFGGTSGVATPDFQIREMAHFPAGSQLYWDLASPAPATATLAAGGSHATGFFGYGIVAVSIDGGESLPIWTPGCNFAGGNLTCNLTWTAVPGATSYRIYTCSNQVLCQGGANALTASLGSSAVSFSDTTGTISGAFSMNNGVSQPAAGGGTTSISQNSILTPQVSLSSPLSGNVSFSTTMSTEALTANQTQKSPNISGDLCVTNNTTNNLGVIYAGLPCTSLIPPAVQGQYAVTYAPTTNAVVAPTAQQIGLTGRGLSGATSSDVILFSDNNSTVVHVQAATGTVNPETLPTAITLNNPAFVFKYCNNSPQTDTIVPTTWTIQVGNNAAASSLSVAPSTCYLIHVDPTSTTNWLADANGSSGAGNPCTTTALSFQYNNAGAFGCVPDLTFSTPHTALLGAAGIVDLSAGAPTTAFKVPAVAGAVPTADKLVGFNLTTHALVWGSNGVTIVGAAAGTGTSGGTTCTSQFIQAISATAAPSCVTVAFDKSTTGLGNPTADATFTQPNTSVTGWTLAGTAPGSSSGATGTNATSLLVINGVTGGADSNATGTAGIGSSPLVTSGNGGAGTGTNTIGGAGGSYSITAGNGGASAGTGANSNGGSINLTPGLAGTGGSGAAGQNGVVKIAGQGAGFLGLVQGADNSGDTLGCAAANTACLEAPSSVTTYTVKVPGAAAQGNVTGTLSGSIITQGISGDTNHSAVVTIGSGTSIGSTQLCSTANCPVGTYRVNAYLDITTACATSGTYVANLIYTDDQGSKTVPINIQGTGAVPATGVLTTTSTANFGQAAQIIRSTGAASINYSTTAVACGSAGPMVGKMYLSVEAIQ